jgi:2-keto-4-pentenoate hydratase/2-oxohepta-3-ene-1,7-dioic acid hydratase in catechol pathway
MIDALASYRVGGEAHYGAVVEGGIIPVRQSGGHLSTFATLSPGDVVEVEVPGIGLLRNRVVDEA